MSHLKSFLLFSSCIPVWETEHYSNPGLTLATFDLCQERSRGSVSINSADPYFQNPCRMAPLEQGGVVDSIGKVHGVENLFVADDSIVPNRDGSPMSTAYLAGANLSLLISEKDRETRDHAPCRRPR
jgi:hypothetical protein